MSERIFKSKIKSYKMIHPLTSSGSIPEEDDGKLYNTCLVFDPSGELILKHRKVVMQQLQRSVSIINPL